MKKFKYIVYSMEYTGSLARLRPTGRIVRRKPQVLFNPSLDDLQLFNLSMTDRRVISDLEVGDQRIDRWGDLWERIA